MTAPSNGSLPPPVEPERRNLAVPIIGGATVLVLLAAGVIVFRGSSPEPEAPAQNTAESEATEPSEASAPAAATAAATKPVDPLGPNPLDTTKTMIDAAQRARAWNADALLAGISADVTDGKPQGPIKISYGASTGDSLAPGSRLGAQRLELEYLNGTATQTTGTSKEQRVGLPDPNCPLEAAWLRATDAGIPRSTPVTIRYESSKKQANRPVWTVQPTDKSAPRTIDGSSCTVVVR